MAKIKRLLQSNFYKEVVRMRDELSLGIRLLEEKIEDTPLYLYRKYWESKGLKGFNTTIRKEIINLHDRNLSPIPYLIDLLKQYPDAPDVMNLFITYLSNNNEYTLAYKISCKLISLYPHEEYLNGHEFRTIMIRWEIATEPETIKECLDELKRWNEKQKLRR